MSANPFIGDVEIFAGTFAPRSWAMCDGQLLAISSNTALFSIIGTIYGGDGRTTMALPDLRGRAPIGFGHGPGLSSYKLGQKGGAESVHILQPYLPSMQSTVSLPSTTQSVSVSIPGQTITDVTGSANIATTQNADTGEPAAGAALATVVAGGGPDKQELIYQTAPSSLLSLGNVSVDSFDIPAQENVALTLPANSLQGTASFPGGNQAMDVRTPYLAMNYIIALQGLFPSRN
ncbi:phage tail protein [Pseudoalteromonas sp. SaAl2]